MRPYNEDENLRSYLLRVAPGQVPGPAPGEFTALPVGDVQAVYARVEVQVANMPRLVIPKLDVQFLGLYRDMGEIMPIMGSSMVIAQPPVHFELHGMPLPDVSGTLYGLDIKPRKDTPH